ncbi:MAG: Mpo1-like protein [Myxococcaceae bacterium]
MGRPSWEAWISEYSKSHQHPANRTCHTIGIPMIAVSIAILPAAFLAAVVWKVSLLLFVVGWVFQFIGHAFEGKPPEFLKDWRFLFVGLRWWFAKVQGKA